MAKKQIKEESSSNSNFPFIGIGASAGGLESLKKLFSVDVENLGMAYIIVVHMNPKQPSLMPEILQKLVAIPVKELEDGEIIKADNVYIAPANKAVKFAGGCIQLQELSQKKPLNQIDSFFKTLALDQKENATAVVLSGTGSDGSEGIKHIKENHGLVIAESEASAKYDSMPISAINTGLTDMILSSEQIIARLTQYHFLNGSVLSDDDIKTFKENSIWLNKIYSILQTKIGHNFSHYKTNTILRRISRRMGIAQIENPKEYLTLLKNSNDEVELLFNELLIGVTSFFRDPKSYEALSKKALETTFKEMHDEQTFRVWVPGCSTGEEVFSLIMVMRELLDQIEKRINLQVFGTDVDKIAINKAREGVYADSIAEEVSPKRIKRFFEKQGNCYKIRKEIRDCAIFSIQDVVKDPPFSKLNLVCCRNLLIYLNTTAQKRILPLFHYTLNPEGILLLGSSETIGSFSNLFTTVDNKWKIFKRREVPRSLIHQVEFPSGITKQPYNLVKTHHEYNEPETNVVKLAQKLILDQYSPTAILVDGNGTILYVQGRTGKYLETTSGAPSLNILDQAREGLRIELSSALREASTSKDVIIRKNIEVKTNGDYQSINLKVNKIYTPKELSGRILVVFEEVDFTHKTKKTADSLKSLSNGEKTRLYDLEKELQHTRESHQVTIEELESSNEELKSTNEELQSSNEELQSTNEELESSKEELQSLNEELQTVNSELQSKVDELSGAHDDMRNLLNSTQIATIFVDMDINVKRFTAESSAIINLIQTDIGRPLKHVVINLKDENLIDDIEYVLNNLSTIEKEVQTKDKDWYKLRIMPYRTTDNRIDGAVLTFSPITEQKQATLKIENAWQLTREAFDLNNNPLAIIGNYGRVVIANTQFSSLIGVSPETVEGVSLFKLKNRIVDQQILKEVIKKTKGKKKKIDLKDSGLVLKYKRCSISTQYIKMKETNESFILLEVIIP